MKRFEWVKGWLTGGTDPADGSVECGDGTAYPMEVTLDQLAEIFFRVKDAKFTAGEISITAGGLPINLYASTDAPTQRVTEGIVETLKRGYYTPSVFVGATVSAFNDGYLQPEYDAGNSVYYREIGNKEIGMWLQGVQDVTLPYWNVTNFEWVNAFTSESFLSYGSPSAPSPPYWFYSSEQTDYFGGRHSVTFNGKVAVIRANATDDISAPTNRLFIGMEFYCYTEDVTFHIQARTLPWAGELSVGNYTIRLASGDVSCLVYVDPDSYDPGSLVVTDFIHTATEWWPYQANNPPADVWNPATGLPL